jgi:hypothetical protein
MCDLEAFFSLGGTLSASIHLALKFAGFESRCCSNVDSATVVLHGHEMVEMVMRAGYVL